MSRQPEIVAFLCEKLAPVEVITTHVSTLIIGRDRVLKLKRPVRFPFLDFTALAARKDACAREVEINRRTAPEIYKGVVAITQDDDGSLHIGDGGGEAVEYAVDMVPFDQATLFDRLAAQEGGLRRPVIERLADEIAAFHEAADIATARGGYAGIRMIAENNAASFARFGPDVFDTASVAHVVDATLARIDAARDILEQRRIHGRVRACHGDLHCRNICLIGGKPVLFDAIEFSPDFSEIDVLYDLAFLLMDLEFRGHRRLASLVLNRYFDVGNETPDALSVLPIFLSMRAQIRAHVGAAIAAAQTDEAAAEAELVQARAYLELAAGYTNPPTPVSIAVGGLSGSGKSRLARELAPFVGAAPGARVVRTDVVRKRIAGVHPNARLSKEGYSADMTARTYAEFEAQAAAVLAGGHSVIMDAVFALPEQRFAVARVFEEAGVPMLGLWVDAPEDVRVARVDARTNNVSDADAGIARGQSDYDLGEIDWRIVDSSGTKKETLEAALRILASTL